MKNTFETLSVIILAAGDSKRMGIPKGLLEYKGKTFLTHQITCLQRIGFRDIIAVLGKDGKNYQENVPELKDIETTINPKPENGPFSSILCGLQEISDKNHFGVFILPIDVPCPNKKVWEELASGLFSFDVNVSIPEFQGRRGHPVFLSEEFRNHLLACSPTDRLDFEINKQKEIKKAKIISVDDKNITLNLNTREEWNAFKVKQ